MRIPDRGAAAPVRWTSASDGPVGGGGSGAVRRPVSGPLRGVVGRGLCGGGWGLLVSGAGGGGRPAGVRVAAGGRGRAAGPGGDPAFRVGRADGAGGPGRARWPAPTAGRCPVPRRHRVPRRRRVSCRGRTRRRGGRGSVGSCGVLGRRGGDRSCGPDRGAAGRVAARFGRVEPWRVGVGWSGGWCPLFLGTWLCSVVRWGRCGRLSLVAGRWSWRSPPGGRVRGVVLRAAAAVVSVGRRARAAVEAVRVALAVAGLAPLWTNWVSPLAVAGGRWWSSAVSAGRFGDGADGV
ncbi:hypothetical protein CFP65_0007 [Kitasatospora sp. MMS16-BH015]|nr:hypothetical protein CFP65_0007 [Kitasatospora sp. MMS16-BH015]